VSDEEETRRRLAALALVAVVVVLGAGIGTITLTGAPPIPGGDASTAQSGTPGPDDRTDGDVRPASETPASGGTGDGDTGSPTPIATDGDDGSETGSDGESDATDGGDRAVGGGGGETVDEQVTVSLQNDGEGTLLAATGVVPGDTGTESMTLTNRGDRAGTVGLAGTEITDRENGIVGPEARVDDTPGVGELSEAVAVRMTFEYPDGTDVFVVGSESEYVTLADLNGSARPARPLGPGEDVLVRLDWRVDEGAGNEIQSDGTVFDAVFRLRSPSP